MLSRDDLHTVLPGDTYGNSRWLYRAVCDLCQSDGAWLGTPKELLRVVGLDEWEQLMKARKIIEPLAEKHLVQLRADWSRNVLAIALHGQVLPDISKVHLKEPERRHLDMALRCSTCEETKQASAFQLCASVSNVLYNHGYAYACKECTNAYKRARNAAKRAEQVASHASFL